MRCLVLTGVLMGNKWLVVDEIDILKCEYSVSLLCNELVYVCL